MTRFQTKQRTELLGDMVARVVARTRLSDLHDGAVGKQILAATAVELEDIHDQMAALLALFDPATAEGEDLDALARVWSPLGLAGRAGAVAATGAETCTRNFGAGATIIPRGTVFAAPGTGTSPDVTFETTAEATIPAGLPPLVVNVAIRCLTPGTIGNVGATAISKKFTAVAGLDAVSNLVALSNGQDEESDDAVRGRIWEYLWSLAGAGTPWALAFLARTIGVAVHADDVQGAAVKVYESDTSAVRRCVFARALEYPAMPGVTDLYIDDGTGFTGVGAAQLFTTVANQILVTSATGGERRIQTGFWPVRVHSPFTLEIQLLGAGAWVAQVEGVDYTVNRSTGLIVLTTALTATDRVRCGYTYYIDLVRAVQYAIEGDPADRLTWPGARGAGGIVYVRRPATIQVAVTADLTVAPGKDEAAAIALADTAMDTYISALDIGEDFIRSEAIQRIMDISGVIDVDISVPATNYPIASYEKATPGAHTIT